MPSKQHESYLNTPLDRPSYAQNIYDDSRYRDKRSLPSHSPSAPAPSSSIRRSSPNAHRRKPSPRRGSERIREQDDQKSYGNRSYSSPSRERHCYGDRDREGRSPRRRSPNRSRHDYSSEQDEVNSFALAPTGSSSTFAPKLNPSREVIMEGLPANMTKTDIQYELTNGYHIEGLKEIRVIRDKNTGESKQFGFLEFDTLQLSEAFMNKNSPSIRFYGPNDVSKLVRLEYSRERDDDPRDSVDWVCVNCTFTNYGRRSKCFRCPTLKDDSVLQTQVAMSQASINTGDGDASVDSIPSQFLLFRGLEPGVTEEVFAKGAMKLYKTENLATKKPTSKVASTTDSSHFGAQKDSIRRVFLARDSITNESRRFGFAEFHLLHDAQAALAKFQVLDRFTIASKPILVSYIHAGVFIPSIKERVHTFTMPNNPAVKLAYWDQGVCLRELIVSAKGPESYRTSTIALAEAKDESKPKEGKSKKRKAEPLTSFLMKKAMPSQLLIWKNKQAELHSLDHEKVTTNNPDESEKKETIKSYVDVKSMCCFICSRKFKSVADVHQHETSSQLHRDNLNNQQAIAKAEQKLNKAGIVNDAELINATVQLPESMAPSSLTDLMIPIDYRDRAKERRQAFGQPSKPKASSKTLLTQGNAITQKATSADEKDEVKVNLSKGASFLGKMGWTEGQGLGTEGTGITNAISTDVYAKGAGLGAVGSKLGDASKEVDKRNTGGYNAFIERSKEGARERYKNMK